MLLQAQKVSGLKVISLHTNHPTARLLAPIIDPDKLLIPAFYCQTNANSKLPLLLLNQSVRQWGPGRLFINSVDEISDPTDLVRYQQLLKLKFELIGKPVRTSRGQRLGKVEDYVFEADSGRIQKLHVKRPLLKSLSTGSLIIDRHQIISVDNKSVTVEDATITKPVPAAIPPA